ncbi:UNVERIFIED_CONTAM: Geranylgeranyl pyrophosphate synthase [Trichonephila clavipes]
MVCTFNVPSQIEFLGVCYLFSSNRKKLFNRDIQNSAFFVFIEVVLIQDKAHCSGAAAETQQLLDQAFNYWLNIPLDKCSEIGEIVQMLHNASLLIDDIEDNSKLRRGVPVAHNIFGIASTINSANYVYFLGLERTLKLGHPNATAVFTEQLLELHRGQGMEIYWRDNFLCPTEQEYKEMVKRKTGGLFGLGVKLMQLFSSNKSDFTTIVALMGLYFQIRDDYANLQSKECIDIIRQRTTDVEIKRYAVDLMEKMGSFEYSRNVLKELDAQARTEINRLGCNKYLIAVLDELKLW